MKQGLKQEILETARRLFNERGYSGVSMRDIAGVLEISVGNLTYHFSKKEDLIEAIIVNYHQFYHKPEAPRSLKSLHKFFLHLLDVQAENVAYFTYYAQLGRMYPSVHEIQMAAIHDIRDALSVAISRLQQDGMIKPDRLSGQSGYSTDALVMVCCYGMTMEKDLFHMEMPENRLRLLWGLVFPLLTKKGRKTYQKEIAPKLKID